jgi:hypothetical protein
MRRIKTTALLLAVGLLTLATEGSVSAQSAGPTRSYVGDWVYYTWELPSPGSTWGDKKVKKVANIPMFAANLDCNAFRAMDASGTISGGAADTGSSGAGLVVLNPVAGNEYSWTATCDLSPCELRGEVDCSDLGHTAGRAMGGIEMQVYGDLKWRIQRAVDASSFSGGTWVLGLSPMYVMPTSDATIAHCKRVDVQPLAAHANSDGIDHHVQVRYRGRVSGMVMAHCQAGLDKRSVISKVELRASASLILSGYTKLPPPPDAQPRPPILRARLRMWFGDTLLYPYGLYSSEEDEAEKKAAAEGEAGADGETTEDDGETTEGGDDDGEATGDDVEEADPSAGGETKPEDIPPPPPQNGKEHDPDDFEVEDW